MFRFLLQNVIPSCQPKGWHSLWWLLQLSGLDTTMQSSHPAVPIIDSPAKQKKEQRKKCHGRMTSGGISEEPSVWMPSYVSIAEEMNPNFDRVLEKMAVKRHREHVEGGNCDPFWAFPSPLSSLLSKLELILYRYFCQFRAWATPHLIFFSFLPTHSTTQFNPVQGIFPSVPNPCCWMAHVFQKFFLSVLRRHACQ